jgi:dihydroneopterin aldolase
MTSDRIRIKGVEGKGFHGVLPEERQTGQPFIVDVELSVSLAAAGASDDLSHTVDYAAVAQAALAVIEGEPLNLIEAVAERIATAVLALGGIEEVRVTVHKPEAPVGVPVSDVSVTVVRTS